MVSPPPDFESSASANFATSACCFINITQTDLFVKYFYSFFGKKNVFSSYTALRRADYLLADNKFAVKTVCEEQMKI